MKKNASLLVLLIALCLSFGAEAQIDQLIPKPVKVVPGTGSFSLSPQVQIVAPANKELAETASLFADQLFAVTGKRLKIVRQAQKGVRSIQFGLNKATDPLLGTEGYSLTVKPNLISVSANKPAGIFYGIQSIVQMLPAKSAIRQLMVVPAVQITDYPRFGWRGLMLDVSRHFFSKEFVKKYIDQMVKYKYNVFHWHLTDDPGWRIEIKKYPRLTEVGAWRVARTGPWGSYPPPQPGEAATDGGFYTQQDIREIVKYADDRFVTIVPEIDVPGHSMALNVAYPELSCSGTQYSMYPGSNGGMGENVICAGSDRSFEVLDDIFAELAELFPGKFIHAGGDEVDKTFWKKCAKCQKRMKDNGLKDEHELQSYFMKRVEKILSSKGKKMIGWDEILEGGLAPGAAVMSWRGPEGGIAAAKLGHEVVMSPLQFCYLDYQQSDMSIERTGGGYVKLSDTYKFEPVPEGVDPKFVLGGQGNVWTEFIHTPGRAEYMTWPRAFALAEILWSPKAPRDFTSFKKG